MKQVLLMNKNPHRNGRANRDQTVPGIAAAIQTGLHPDSERRRPDVMGPPFSFGTPSRSPR
ncbi:MAG: hypothetical protein AAGG01_22145, partial [Planctomycetota bacterium]